MKWEVILENFAEKLCIKKSRTSFGSAFQHFGFCPVFTKYVLFSHPYKEELTDSCQQPVCGETMSSKLYGCCPSPQVFGRHTLYRGVTSNISSCLELSGSYNGRFRSGIWLLKSHLMASPIQMAILNRVRGCFSFMTLFLQ